MFRSFVFIVMLGMACASSAEAVFECPADRIPIQTTSRPVGLQPAVIMLASFKLYDRPGTPFHKFVRTVTEDVATQLARKKLCLANTEFQRYVCQLPEEAYRTNRTNAEHQKYRCQDDSYSNEPGFPRRYIVDILTPEFVPDGMGDKASLLHMADKTQPLLQFVEWDLTAPSEQGTPSSPHPVSPLDVAPPTSRGCRITSPWLDFAFEPRPVPWVRGVIRWNPRQMLMDQAMLTGRYNAPKGLLMPLERSEYRKFDKDYENNFSAIYPDLFMIDVKKNSRYAYMPPNNPIIEHIPPDIMWLFHRIQSNRRLLLDSFLDEYMEKGAEHYTRLVTALIDQCFANEGADLHYKSILDVANLISLEEYKIMDDARQFFH